MGLLSYMYLDDSYARKYPTFKLHNVAGGLEYDLGQYFKATKGRFNVSYDHYDFQVSQMDSFSSTLGLTRNFSELWSISLESGPRYTSSRFSKYAPVLIPPYDVPIYVIQEQTAGGWTWTAKASLNYKGERISGEISYVRDLMPASGYAGATERDYFRLNVSYRITYELTAQMNIGYFSNKSDTLQYSVQHIDMQSYSFNPRLRYEFTKDIAVDLSYTYGIYDNRQADTRADRHIVFLQLYIQHAFFE